MKNPLLNMIPYEEFDYQTLLDAVHDYSQPRQKISQLLSQGAVVRVKKGLYVKGEPRQRGPYSREILANLIYGPSYLSLEYALQHYGLAPERVPVVTSVTTGRSRVFSTPVGTFSYRMIPLDAFQLGIDRAELADGRGYLIATPEKALADLLVADRGAGITSQKELHTHLLEDLRLDPDGLSGLDPAVLAAIALAYRSRRVKLLADLLTNLRRRGGAQ
jgi:predicted transcriptional regulator of viral defense system